MSVRPVMSPGRPAAASSSVAGHYPERSAGTMGRSTPPVARSDSSVAARDGDSTARPAQVADARRANIEHRSEVLGAVSANGRRPHDEMTAAAADAGRRSVGSRGDRLPPRRPGTARHPISPRVDSRVVTANTDRPVAARRWQFAAASRMDLRMQRPGHRPGVRFDGRNPAENFGPAPRGPSAAATQRSYPSGRAIDDGSGRGRTLVAAPLITSTRLAAAMSSRRVGASAGSRATPSHSRDVDAARRPDHVVGAEASQ